MSQGCQDLEKTENNFDPPESTAYFYNRTKVYISSIIKTDRNLVILAIFWTDWGFSLYVTENFCILLLTAIFLNKDLFSWAEQIKS